MNILCKSLKLEGTNCHFKWPGKSTWYCPFI